MSHSTHSSNQHLEQLERQLRELRERLRRISSESRSQFPSFNFSRRNCMYNCIFV